MDSCDTLVRTIESIKKGASAAHSYIIEARAGEERDRALETLVASIIGEDINASCMDVVRMIPTGKQGYKAEDATQFIGRIAMDSYGKCTVGIIENAEFMTEVVQNKLLKTLEEPTERTVIILTISNADKLIPTVLSRCVTIKLNDSEKSENGENIDSGIFGYKAFHSFREAIDKGIKSREAAFELIGSLEDNIRRSLIEGCYTTESAASIELIEKTRMDIYNGMNYSKALKRLYLELA